MKKRYAKNYPQFRCLDLRASQISNLGTSNHPCVLHLDIDLPAIILATNQHPRPMSNLQLHVVESRISNMSLGTTLTCVYLHLSTPILSPINLPDRKEARGTSCSPYTIPFPTTFISIYSPY